MNTIKLNRLIISAFLVAGMLFLLGRNPSGAKEITIYQDEGAWLASFVVSAKSPLGPDEYLSREIAIQSALKEAVQTAVEELAGLENSLISSPGFITLIDESYSDYVAEYSIRAEGPHKNEYLVTLHVQVFIGDLATDLIESDINFPVPRVMVAIPEMYEDQTASYTNAETSIIKRLRNAGFEVMDQELSAAIRECGMIHEALHDSPANLINDFMIYFQDADFLIIGEAVSEYSGFSDGLYSCESDLLLKIIETDTGRILSSFECTAGGSETLESAAATISINSAGERALQYLIPQLLLAYDPVIPQVITLNVYDIDFYDLVNFEEDIENNIPGVMDIIRLNYASRIAELEVTYEGSTDDLADYIARNTFSHFPCEIVEYSEHRIALTVTGRETNEQADSESRDTSEQRIIFDRDDGRINLGVFRFDDPYHAGLSNRAANDIGRYLGRLDFYRYCSINKLSRIPQDINNIGLDWLVTGDITDIHYDFYCSPPVYDEDTHRKIVHESFTKRSYLHVNVRIINPGTGNTIYDNTFCASCSDWSQWRCYLDSDRAMIDRNWNSILKHVCIDLLGFMYNNFDEPSFIVSRDPDNNDRAITHLTAGDGLYTEMPMRLYIPEVSGSDTAVNWIELCKVTVKEVHSTYSVIELPDKWFEYFEFGEGNNLLWPEAPDTW